ncbi:MAG: hypothetical protein J5710_02390 [Treponema sp.]|nr:hypothetical protein [Treponema sp.]
MKTNPLNKKFYPPQEKFDTLPIREQEQLSMLIGSNLVFMIMFTLFGAALFVFGYPVIGGGAVCLLAFFIASLIFIKQGHIHRGSWTTTIAIAMVTAVEALGAPFSQTNFLPYRESCFMVVMVICNYVVSLRRKQIHTFFAFIIILWAVINATIYRPLYSANIKAALLNIIICSLGVITANIAILLYDSFTRRVVERAAENEQKTADALGKISNVLNETKEGMNIGKELSASTDKAANNVEEIDKLYAYINTETAGLSSDAGAIRDSSAQINDKAAQMKQSVQNQNQSITQTSAALNQMSSSLTNLSSIATQQRSGMDSLVQNLDSQMKLMQQLVDDVQKVKESSDKVANFVQAVNRVASQTGLLAMNASIEAAHAGTLGKGFSVIAQEIRKLSEETSRNAQNITETLAENVEIVAVTTDSVTRFSDYTRNTTDELRNAITTMEEILAGISDIDNETKRVMESINLIVQDSDTNTRLAQGVAEEIIQQNSSLQNISDGTTKLQQKVASLEDLLSNIRSAISEINSNASRNEEFASKISGALN